MLSQEEYYNMHLILSELRWDLSNTKWERKVQEQIDLLEVNINTRNNDNCCVSVYLANQYIICSFLYYFISIQKLLSNKKYKEVFKLIDDIHEFPQMCAKDRNLGIKKLKSYNHRLLKKLFKYS